jgi:acetoin utilization deacetylase AcuC-like enzyme
MTKSENRNIGFPWTLQHVNRTLSSAGGTVAAACDAYEEYVRRCNAGHANAHLCWSAHVAGGTHHAFRDYGEGFCVFSDIAVAANVLLQKYPCEQSSPTDSTISRGIRRILIIDLDVHQGNGNAVLFKGNDKVQTFSVHCRSNYFSKKEESDLDVELPPGCTDETYLSTLKYWLRRIEEHPFEGSDALLENEKRRKPFDFIFYQAGVDIHKDDRLGRFYITQEGISRRNQLVFEFANRMHAPLTICMGGGYPSGNDWSPILIAHAGVYIEAHQFLSSFVEKTSVDAMSVSITNNS